MTFMEAFCTKSWKLNAFNLSGNENIKFQIISGVLIFAELYFSIMSAVESKIATLFSIFVVIHVLFTLFCYFGVMEIKAVEVFQSYFANMVFAAVAFGYLMTSVSNGQGIAQFGYSFLIMA